MNTKEKVKKSAEKEKVNYIISHEFGNRNLRDLFTDYVVSRVISDLKGDKIA